MDRPILQPDQMALLIKGLAIDDNPQQQEYCLSILLNLAAEGEPPSASLIRRGWKSCR